MKPSSPSPFSIPEMFQRRERFLSLPEGAQGLRAGAILRNLVTPQIKAGPVPRLIVDPDEISCDFRLPSVATPDGHLIHVWAFTDRSLILGRARTEDHLVTILPLALRIPENLLSKDLTYSSSVTIDQSIYDAPVLLIRSPAFPKGMREIPIHKDFCLETRARDAVLYFRNGLAAALAKAGDLILSHPVLTDFSKGSSWGHFGKDRPAPTSSLDGLPFLVPDYIEGTTLDPNTQSDLERYLRLAFFATCQRFGPQYRISLLVRAAGAGQLERRRKSLEIEVSNCGVKGREIRAFYKRIVERGPTPIVLSQLSAAWLQTRKTGYDALENEILGSFQAWIHQPSKHEILSAYESFGKDMGLPG